MTRSGTFARRAMSLTEISVTVVTIAAMVGLFIPAASELRREAKELRCLANLGRISAASAVYAVADSQELAVPVHRLYEFSTASTHGGFEWGGKSGAGQPVNGNSTVDSIWGTQNGRGPGSRKLNDVLYKNGFNEFRNDPGPNSQNWFGDTHLDLDVFRCPGDYGYSGSHFKKWRDQGFTSFDHYGNSYAANTSWIGVAGGGCTLASNSPFARPISRVPNPARTLLFLENAGLYAWRQNYGEDDCSAGTNNVLLVDDLIRGWHGTPFVFQVAFSDGHGARVHMDGHLHAQPDIGRYPEWNGNPTEYLFWHCVINRGADWQRDTLPAPPVRTTIPCNASAAPDAAIGLDQMAPILE